MKRLYNLLIRGISSLIRSGVWRIASYKDGKIIDINQSINLSAADPFIYKKRDGSFVLLFESYSPFEIQKKGKIYVGNYDIHQSVLSSVRILHEEKGHISFPSIVKIDENYYFSCESSYSGSIKLWPLDEEAMCISGEEIVILENIKAIDPFIFVFDHNIYLFLTTGDGDRSLTRLFVTKSIDQEFTEHPESPIALGRRHGRNASNIFMSHGSLHRATQSNVYSYGESMSIFQIKILSPTEYEEIYIETIKRPIWVSNMHTFSKVENVCVIDYDTFGINFKKWIFLCKVIKSKIK